MKKSVLLIACISAAFACNTLYAQASAGAGPRQMGQPTNTQGDMTFVSQASAANLTEIEEGNLAMSQGQSAAVKAFGNKMVTDHTAANAELNSIAAARHMGSAAQPTSRQQQMIDSLKGMNGAAFDQRYARMAVRDHEDAIRLFTSEAAFGSSPDLRTYAAKTLPTLKQHLSMAKALPGS